MSLSELRHTAGLPNAGFPEVARILFDGNAKIASRTFGIPIGRIQKGAAADIIIMDYIPYTAAECREYGQAYYLRHERA